MKEKDVEKGLTQIMKYVQETPRERWNIIRLKEGFTKGEVETITIRNFGDLFNQERWM